MTNAALDLHAAPAPLQRRVLLAYGLGDAGTGMASALVGFYLFMGWSLLDKLSEPIPDAMRYTFLAVLVALMAPQTELLAVAVLSSSAIQTHLEPQQAQQVHQQLLWLEALGSTNSQRMVLLRSDHARLG